MNIRIKFLNEVAKCIEKAIELYNLDPQLARTIPVDLDLKGRVGGYAGYKTEYGVRKYYLRFNAEGIEKHWDYMVNNVIPHEVAHIVAFMRPEAKATGHNRVWKRIDLSLGGNGKRCHNMPLTKAKRTTWYIYNVAGETIHLSSVRHNRLQSGKQTYRIKLITGSHKIECCDYSGESIVK